MLKLHKFRKYFLLLSFVLVVGCAIAPPVQEMSNARQTIQAARDAGAAKHAVSYLDEAENMMKSASEALDSGDYLSARELAVSAQQQAIKARQQALSNQKSSK